MTTRRQLLVFGTSWPALAWGGAAYAQAPIAIRRIGLLSSVSPSVSAPWLQAFRTGLRDLGWVEGKNISIEYRYADGRNDRLPELAADLIRLKVDVIVASAVSAALVVQKATKAIPVVVAAGADPVASGLVESLARPGGNITGLSEMAPELAGKRLQLLKEVIPTLTRVAVLWNPRGVASTLSWKESHPSARQLGIQLHSLEARSVDDFDKAFDDATKARAGAVIVTGDPVTGTHLMRIAGLAAKSRLPSIFHRSEFAEAGGLMGYGPDRADLFRRAASFVDKILKGARPADLPVEQPTKFELVVNLKTAKTIGITIPPSVMVRATKVIE